MNYIEYDFKVNPLEPAVEILIAELGDVGFESFVENEQGVLAYIQQDEWNEHILKEIQILSSDEFEISYTFKIIEQINWNIEWEKNFQPIDVDGIVSIRAPFHENPSLKFDIVIEPKMSFGTGHHETTHMMIQHLLKVDLNNKKVLDMGSGTGILAIFAEMRGAAAIDAIDIDEWCFENAVENIERNNCKNINVYQGDVALLSDKNYDLIIANINRNVLLADMAQYAKCLNTKGILLLSGFYTDDILVLETETLKHGLHIIAQKERNNWASLKLIKQ
ncbi:MAG: 50S ribosomal protein L11 methyltransferase [Flavobacteriaceae bacterium]|nr:50S ribosomal protein L11 methyltransferase [Flavobacteriaceae bacterium]